MKTVIITETQIKRVLDNLVSEGHNTKELKKLLSWAERKANCAVSDTKDGGRLCPPKSTGVPCYSFHRKDSAVEPIKNHIAKAYGVSKKEVNDAYSKDESIGGK